MSSWSTISPIGSTVVAKLPIFSTGPAGLHEQLLSFAEVARRRGDDGLFVDQKLPTGLHRRPYIVLADKGRGIFRSGRRSGGPTARRNRGAVFPIRRSAIPPGFQKPAD